MRYFSGSASMALRSRLASSSAIACCSGPGPAIGPVGKFFIAITFAAVQPVATGVVGDGKDPGAELRARVGTSASCETP